MKPNIKLDRFLNSTVLATSIFIAGGCYKTYKDYKNATPKFKDKFLIKDSVVLSGAALGMLANHTLGNKLIKSKPYNKLINTIAQKYQQSNLNKNIKTSIDYTTAITKEILSGFITATSGIAGALGIDYLLTKSKFEEPEYNQDTDHTNYSKFEEKLEKLQEDETVDAIYNSVTEVPKLRFLSAGMVGIDAIEIAQNNEFEEKLKHTTGYLVNDTLVPLLFLSTANALTQNLKPKFKIPIVVSSLFGGTLITHKLFDKYAKQNTNKA